jgi:probable HAF family extracellular repeat protein
MIQSAVLLMLLCRTIASGGPIFEHLGMPAGADTSMASAVNADGSVIVGWSGSWWPTYDGGQIAWCWTRGGGMQALGPLPDHTSIYATGISGDGSVVVGTSASSQVRRAFRWTRAGGTQDLGVLPGGNLSYATGISVDGSVIVGAGSTADYSLHAFRWTSAAGMQDLGTGGYRDSSASAISADGAVITGQHFYIPFRWTAAAGMQNLTSPPAIAPQVGVDNGFTDGYSPGGSLSTVTGINADGSVIVGMTGNSEAYQAFRWSAVTGFEFLDWLPNEPGAGQVVVTPDGSTVFLTGSTSWGSEAVMWDATHGTRALRDVLSADYSLDLEGFVPYQVGGISADGSTLVGTGINSSQQWEPWSAVLPEPTALPLLVVALCALLRRSRHNSRILAASCRVSKSRRRVPMSIAIAWYVQAAVAASAAPIFQGLWPVSEAWGITPDGSVVVGSAFKAYRWTATQGVQQLDNLWPAGIYSGARGISGDGSVVVGWGGPFDIQHAFRWTRDGGMRDLGTLPGYERSRAYGVSGDGSVIVGGSGVGSVSQATRWTGSGGIEGLGYLPGGNTSNAIGVSSDGSVIVGSSLSPQGWQPFRWTQADGMQPLGFFPGGSIATGISADGSTIIGESGGQAFRWTAVGGKQPLGLFQGAYPTHSLSVSGDGSTIVGYAIVGSDPELAASTAILWDSTGGIRSLRSVLVDDYGLNLDGWRLDQATGISADGSTIIGTGIDPALRYQAWVAVLPEPATLPLLGLGLGPALRLRRHRSHPVEPWSQLIEKCSGHHNVGVAQ